jgi:hypothetical protein
MFFRPIKFDIIFSPMKILTNLVFSPLCNNWPTKFGPLIFSKLKAKLKPNKMENLYQLIKITHEHNIITCQKLHPILQKLQPKLQMF